MAMKSDISGPEIPGDCQRVVNDQNDKEIGLMEQNISIWSIRPLGGARVAESLRMVLIIEKKTAETFGD